MTPVTLLLGAALGAALAVPAAAGTITYLVPVTRTGPAFVSDLTVTLPGAPAALGTPTGETLTLAGTYAPGAAWVDGWGWDADGAPAATLPVTLTPRVGPDHAALTTLAPEALTAILDGPVANDGTMWQTGDYVATGTPEPFSVTYALPAGAIGEASADVWAMSGSPGHLPENLDLGADLGALDATLTVAYAYAGDPPADPVPEPASLPLLAWGVVALVGVGAIGRLPR